MSFSRGRSIRECRRAVDTGAGDQETRHIPLLDLGKDTIRFAMDGIPLFRFEDLRELFPDLPGRDEFIRSENFLGSGPINQVEAVRPA